MTSEQAGRIGVSGMSVYVPALRVPLEAWCGWTNHPWEKIRAVVGESFRCAGPQENVYTMAASAVLRLIRTYDVDPRTIGYLALGTETSTDNSAGAVIVRGMVDRALEQLGLPRLSRACEVPELKHACLAGVYGMKAAARYLATDGAGKRAIVVSADIAEYERGSSGEQTQGAGAVALLMDGEARLFEVDLNSSGSASSYRGPDFRKPHRRHRIAGYAEGTTKQHDFPVFSGKYSTFAYLDETLHAFAEMARRTGCSERQLSIEEADAFFFHRPYQHMPVQAMGYLYLRAGLDAGTPTAEIEAACKEAGVEASEVVRESRTEPDLFARVLDGRAEEDPYPATSRAASQVRRSAGFKKFVADKMSLGSAGARHLGNLYTAALFAWLASGFEEALQSDRDLTGARFIALGYGSGDAAEAVLLRVSPEWREAARRIHFDEALASARDLDQGEYEGLHDGRPSEAIAAEPSRGFRVTKIGDTATPTFQDLGIEYYDYVD